MTESPLAMLCALLGVLGAVLVLKKRRAGYMLWIIANTGFIIDHLAGQRSAQTLMFAVYFVISIWGWHAWKEQ